MIDTLLAIPKGPGVGDGHQPDPLLVANRDAGNQQKLSILTNQVHQLKLDVAQVKMELATTIAVLRNYNARQLTLFRMKLGKLLQQAPSARRVANQPVNAATAAGTTAATRREFVKVLELKDLAKKYGGTWPYVPLR